MVRYALALPNPSSHLIAVSIEFETSNDDWVDVEFPSWSPGRYYVYDFARNVENLVATGDGEPLVCGKTAKGTWRIQTAGASRIRVTYQMFANTISGTFSQLDDRHASINGHSVFAYVRGRETEPIELTIEAPMGWKSYSSMKRRRRAGRTVLTAANYDHLADSPIEIGTPIHRHFRSDGIDYHVVMDFAAIETPQRSAAVKEQIDRFVGDVQKTVHAYARTFGAPELEEFYFLVNIDPNAPSGDGMEHLSSTRLVIPGFITDEDTYSDLVGVMSHEFFHVWNVKRLRPAEFGRLDYTKERHTTLLWFAEGFTQYYGHLMLRRVGVWQDQRFLKELAGELNAVDQSPGRFHRNLREASYDTWYSLGVRNPQAFAMNFQNAYVCYYPKGAVAALILDLEIRRLTRNERSLDDVIRELYRSSYAEKEFGAYHVRGDGFTEEDVLDSVEKVAGRTARRILLWLVESKEEIDYARYLRHVGIGVVRKPPDGRKGRHSASGEHGVPYTGIIVPEARLRAVSEFVTISSVAPGSPAANAGLSMGDLLVAINGERVDARRWEQQIGMYRAGEKVELVWFRGARLLRGDLTIANEDRRPIRLEMLKKATEKQKSARERWLSVGGHAGPPASVRGAN